MNKEDLMKRISDLGKAVTESAETHARLKTMLDNTTNHHNVLVGRLEEAKMFSQQFEKDEQLKDMPAAANTDNDIIPVAG